MTDLEYAAEIRRLAEKYDKYGFNEMNIGSLVNRLTDSNTDREVALTAVKVGLATEHPEAGGDLFTMEEVCHALGCTEDEVRAAMKEEGVEPVTISAGIRFEEENE